MILLIIAGIVVLVVMYRKKSRKKHSLGKTELAHTNTETSAEEIYTSPQDVCSTIRNEYRIDTENIHAAVKEMNDSKEQEFSHYDEINIEMVDRRQNRSTSQTGRMHEVECHAELYSVVGTSESENTAYIPEHRNVMEVYAEVSKDLITASQEFDGEVNGYTVVDKTTKIMHQEQNSEVHMEDKSLESNRISVEPDSSNTYSVVDKNRTYSTSSGSVGSGT